MIGKYFKAHTYRNILKLFCTLTVWARILISNCTCTSYRTTVNRNTHTNHAPMLQHSRHFCARCFTTPILLGLLRANIPKISEQRLWWGVSRQATRNFGTTFSAWVGSTARKFSGRLDPIRWWVIILRNYSVATRTCCVDVKFASCPVQQRRLMLCTVSYHYYTWSYHQKSGHISF